MKLDPRIEPLDVAIFAAVGLVTFLVLMSTMGIGVPRDESFYYHAAVQYVGWFEQMSVDTGRTVSMVDITARVAAVVEKSGCVEGTVTVLAKHSTVGVMLNEFEERFVSDARQWLQRIAPPSYPWLHNDVDFRAGPPGYEGGDEVPRSTHREIHTWISCLSETPLRVGVEGHADAGTAQRTFAHHPVCGRHERVHPDPRGHDDNWHFPEHHRGGCGRSGLKPRQPKVAHDLCAGAGLQRGIIVDLCERANR